MPRKRLNVKSRIEGLSETAFAILMDAPLPADASTWEEWELGYPTVRVNKCRALWTAYRELILTEYIRQNPGRRPSWWWLFDEQCPRLTSFDVESLGWPKNASWLVTTPQPRRRVGGVGIPHGLPVDGYVPEFHCGISENWISIDPADPPRFESQAAYLNRHGLLTGTEKKYLSKHPELLEPEAVLLEESEASS
jgi:hypothetical protein